jgi:hypothetical protein
MTTFLIYAAALLVSLIVLVIVAFVYVIMNEDDKNDQDKNRLTLPTMTLKVFLDDTSFHCLKHSIPRC